MDRTVTPRRILPPEDVTEEYLRTAAPGQGAVTYGDGYRAGTHLAEIEMAAWLHHKLGGDIALLAESTERGVKTPDYLWRGKCWELKGARSLNGVDKALQQAIKQIQDNPGGVILNVLCESELPSLERQIFGRFLRSGANTLDVIVLYNGELVKIIRYKK